MGDGVGSSRVGGACGGGCLIGVAGGQRPTAVPEASVYVRTASACIVPFPIVFYITSYPLGVVVAGADCQSRDGGLCRVDINRRPHAY